MVQFIVVDKAQQQEHEGAGHVASAVRKQRDVNVAAQLALSQEPSLQMVQPMSKQVFHAQLSLSGNNSQTYSVVFFLIILNPGSLTMKINHCIAIGLKSPSKNLLDKLNPGMCWFSTSVS